MAITLTETAAQQIKQVLRDQNMPEGSMIRIAIAGGGCAGLQYALGFETQFDPKIDTKYEQHGVSLVTQKKMALHLDGTTIDFQKDPMGRGFSIDNPNAPQGGGCPGCRGQ